MNSPSRRKWSVERLRRRSWRSGGAGCFRQRRARGAENDSQEGGLGEPGERRMIRRRARITHNLTIWSARNSWRSGGEQTVRVADAQAAQQVWGRRESGGEYPSDAQAAQQAWGRREGGCGYPPSDAQAAQQAWGRREGGCGYPWQTLERLEGGYLDWLEGEIVAVCRYSLFSDSGISLRRGNKKQ